ncbi:NACHT domain-containing protein [Streptomyces sp. NPDC049916]|uniref:NACHT domain-containing protein n=1 Tax=Streptomyces sp. NPDC049916 TaxID=3155156 RepID=UPI003424874A
MADRTVVVSAIRQGSGVLLTDRLVLTCAHVVKSESVLIAHPARPDRIRATVAWIDYRLDAALLEALEPVHRVPRARLGVLETREAVPGCEITGFPEVQRYGSDRRLEADQYTATVLPLAGEVRDLLVCDLDGSSAARAEHEPPPLSGLSGGPLFVGDVLLGIARQVPGQRGGRRVECVPLGPVLAAEPFVRACRRVGLEPRHEGVHGHFPRDQRYEADYVQALGVAYRRTKVLGLDELSRDEAEWDLDTAYLSLEAQTQDRATPGPPLPQRIDDLLAGHPRVLLRGEAGAGKTTLLWWLAAHASARTLEDHLAPLNGLVPLVVPLRTLHAHGGPFPNPSELPGAAGLVVDSAPEGWASRVLASGRALLLADGLDEVPPEDREQAHTWLARLLARYPDTRCVATVRPLAVEPDWLRSEGFTELRLLPMRTEDIQAFVASWHRAARLSGEDGTQRLDVLERDLSHQFDQNPTLRDLARTPLLCAVICALHRRSEGFLPRTRWQLFSSALEMLLGNRDIRRRVPDPEGVSLTVEQHTQLLQRIAVWLVRGGQAEFTREQGLRQIGRALKGMRQVAEKHSSEAVLTHLLNRSGLLQKHGDDTYQFIHRTFQDFLAAKEFVEDDQLNEVLGHADEEPWQDVILLTAGHCARRDIAVLVRGLLDAGEKHPEGSIERMRLWVRADLCAQHAAYLDGAVSERVRLSTSALFPPADEKQVRALVRLGSTALDFLPEPDRTAPGDPCVESVAKLIVRVGGAPAVPYAGAWLRSHPGLAGLFCAAWPFFPPEEYAADVLAHCEGPDLALWVSDRKRLRALRHIPAVRGLTLTSDLPEEEIAAALRGRPVEALAVETNASLVRLSHLEALADTLSALAIAACPGVRDLTPLARLRRLETLDLDAQALGSVELAALTRLDSLENLTLDHLTVGGLGEIAAHPGVRRLTVRSERPLALDGLDGWTSLVELSVSAPVSLDDALVALRDRPRITGLSLTAFPWAHQPDPHLHAPAVTDLSVQAPSHTEDVGLLRRLFPGVARLTVDASARHVLDLTSLHAWPDLRVRVRGLERPRLIGAEELGDRLVTPREESRHRLTAPR